MDIQYVTDAIQAILPKLPITLLMMACSLLGGLLLGTLIAVIRIKKEPVSNALATLFVSFMRCTPTLVQLFLVFYGLPLLVELFGVDINGWSKFLFAVIALGLHSAASLSEVIRAAYLAVGSGQLEAASSVGMTYWQGLRYIVLPQAFHVALPNLGNAAISLFKETSLAFSIGVVDIMGEAQILINNQYGINIIEVYVVVSLFYWLVSIAIGQAIQAVRIKAAKRYRQLTVKAA